MPKQRFLPVVLDGEATSFVVSDHGEVYNTKTGKRLANSTNKDGYLYVHLRCRPDSLDALESVHRLVAAAFVDGDKSLSVDHIDGDKTNNLYSNLTYMDVAENVRKYHIQKFYKQNKSNGMSRRSKRRSNVFNESDVRKIRENYSSGKTITEIANDFNERYNTIYAVVKHKVHKYVI